MKFNLIFRLVLFSTFLKIFQSTKTSPQSYTWPCDERRNNNLQFVQKNRDDFFKVSQDVNNTKSFLPILEYLSILLEQQRKFPFGSQSQGSFLASGCYRIYKEKLIDALEKVFCDCDYEMEPLKCILDYYKSEKERLERLLCCVSSLEQSCELRLNKNLHRGNRNSILFWLANIVSICRLEKAAETDPIQGFVDLFQEYSDANQVLVLNIVNGCPCCATIKCS